jgi:hypothetical protein
VPFGLAIFWHFSHFGLGCKAMGFGGFSHSKMAYSWVGNGAILGWHINGAICHFKANPKWVFLPSFLA